MKTKKTVKKKNGADKDLKGQLARALADYDNLQKRIEKEKGQYRDLVKISVITSFLPVLDMLEETQDHLADSGLAIAINSFNNVLKDEGLEKISAKKGDVFDEDHHEAVEAEEKKGKGGEIISEILSGWKLGEFLIRPAKVKVTKIN